MGRDSALIKLLSQVDFEEIQLNERSLIRSRQFLERTQPAPGSIGGRKKKAAKKAAPAKAKAESKGKEKVTSSEPPQQTEDEESASFSEKTDTEKTEDDRTVNEADNPAQSPNDAGPDANPETTEGGEKGGEEGDKEADDEGGNNNEEAEEAEADRVTRKLLKAAKRRAGSIEELYMEWHEHRFGTPYREILPGHTDEECMQRLEEVEDLMMNLTNSNTIQEVQHRTCLLIPKVQLRKLTARIRKITEEFKAVGPEDTLTPRVLERLEKAKGDLIQEIDRLEAICNQRKVPVYTAPQIERIPVNCPTPPREIAASKESDERADPNLTGQSPPPQPEVPASDFTKEWVEDRLQKLEASTSELIDNRIQEFEDSAVQPFKDRSQRIFGSALQFADATRSLLERNQERFLEIGEDLQEEAAQRNKYVQRTEILENLTSELKGDFDRFERETDQRLTSMSDDLVGTTLKRVSELEKTNVGLVAELKALSEQVAELLRAKVNADAAAIAADAETAKRIQDALDAEAGKEKEAPRSSHLTEEEAARIRRGEALFPGFTKKAAAQAAEDAERLERQKQKLEEFAAENKKKKAAASASAPKKRKREAPKKEALKKVQIAELLNEVTEPVITSASQQADQVEEEVEEQLQSRSTRPRVSAPTSRPPPEKKKRIIYDFSDSE
ncbi:CAP-Gly domain-containing linker protein 1-like [Impatiens glandulifera]|uniref:CAP-Gly domain-containing linker protein 1-like n=1 Tax=Impatiens glandulifera TaxID=253017 RepID=UPI001FB0564B|nr:CAP-Gly domain-containing linker protein 1-like [Impatiens glandulifera]